MLVTGIGQLVTNDPEAGGGPLGVLTDAAVLVDRGRIAWVGPASDVPQGAGEQRLDVDGRCVVPGFVDAHTHLVFAGHRSPEFTARLQGEPYDGGGIATTVAATRAASSDELISGARRLERVLWNDPGTGVMRHADAGYDIAIGCAREQGLDLPMVGA